MGTKIDIRIVIAIAFAMYGGIIIGLSYMKEFVGWVLMYGLGAGFAQGLPYMLPMNNCYKYFPHNKGTISGICVAGLGFGALIFNQIIFAFMNPDNEHLSGEGYFRQEVADRLPSTMRIMAAIYFGLAVLGNVMIVPFKE